VLGSVFGRSPLVTVPALLLGVADAVTAPVGNAFYGRRRLIPLDLAKICLPRR